MKCATSQLIAVVFIAAVSLSFVPALAQPTYSIDFQGPTALAPALGGPGIVSDGDILTPLPPGIPPFPPTVVYTAGFGPVGLGLAPTPLLGGSHGGVEVDALSYGMDSMFGPLEPDPVFFSHSWTFSVDEFAVGIPTPVAIPSVFTEGASGFFGGPGIMEASADVFTARVQPGLTVPPPPLPALPFTSNIQFADGDGSTAPGLNLIEPPNFPTVGGFPDPGDNLDAWDTDTPLGVVPIYYSLDSDSVLGGPFPIDPLEGPPVSSGSALVNGFVGGDVLVSPVTGAPPALYAPAALLGLDDIAGPDTDDLDALVLFDDGDGIYTPAGFPYDWVFAPGTDMLLYSVRRGSAIIGVPDAISGVPITEGDILVGVVDPLDGLPMQDGIDGDIDVGIFVFAEQLGLGTVRSGTGSALWGPYGVINPLYGVDDWDDELDALDVELVFNFPDSEPDGDVDGLDFLAWQLGLGLVGPGLTESDGEFTGDQVVDGLDLALWEAFFPFPLTAPQTAVPEPTSILLFQIGLFAFIATERRVRKAD